jgi:2-polyprenyl-3-methyl-5-hydroxy-6-metoxy-1,4-benzoquinol methylase
MLYYLKKINLSDKTNERYCRQKTCDHEDSGGAALHQRRLLDIGCGMNRLTKAYGNGVGVDVTIGKC